MNIYYSVGLKELAKASGFQGEILTSLEKCSHFKRTHHFFCLQAWQGMHRQMLHAYITNQNMLPHLSSLYDALRQEDLMPKEFLTVVEGSLSEIKYNDFQAFIQRVSEADDTWKFWGQFVQDCLAYVGLFVAIRCQSWQLRVSSLKKMAPLFAAYDSTTYCRLIPNHLADIQTYPAQVLQCLQVGAFAVSIWGIRGHSVALDEAHKMCINWDMKAAVVRPTKAYLQKTSTFLRYRIAAYKNMLQQIIATETQISTPYAQNCLTTTEPEITKREDNILAMVREIDSNTVLPHTISCNRGLLTAFTGTIATPQQTHDLLNSDLMT